VAEGRFDEQHRGVEREDRRVGRRDLTDQRALRDVAVAAEDLANDELALLSPWLRLQTRSARRSVTKPGAKRSRHS